MRETRSFSDAKAGGLVITRATFLFPRLNRLTVTFTVPAMGSPRTFTAGRKRRWRMKSATTRSASRLPVDSVMTTFCTVPSAFTKTSTGTE
jgi:hypothetical protein